MIVEGIVDLFFLPLQTLCLN